MLEGPDYNSHESSSTPSISETLQDLTGAQEVKVHETYRVEDSQIITAILTVPGVIAYFESPHMADNAQWGEILKRLALILSKNPHTLHAPLVDSPSPSLIVPFYAQKSRFAFIFRGEKLLLTSDISDERTIVLTHQWGNLGVDNFWGPQEALLLHHILKQDNTHASGRLIVPYIPHTKEAPDGQFLQWAFFMIYSSNREHPLLHATNIPPLQAALFVVFPQRGMVIKYPYILRVPQLGLSQKIQRRLITESSPNIYQNTIQGQIMSFTELPRTPAIIDIGSWAVHRVALANGGIPFTNMRYASDPNHPPQRLPIPHITTHSPKPRGGAQSRSRNTGLPLAH